jgi:hypothetical protein
MGLTCGFALIRREKTRKKMKTVVLEQPQVSKKEPALGRLPYIFWGIKNQPRF